LNLFERNRIDPFYIFGMGGDAKDWNKLRDNDNGIMKVIENRIASLSNPKEREINLQKISEKLNGDGYFASAFADSELMALVVDLACRSNNPLALKVLRRGCERHVLVLNKTMTNYFEPILSALIQEQHEDLFLIIEAACRSSKWVRVIANSRELVSFLSQKPISRFSILECIPLQAFQNNAVELCVAHLKQSKMPKLEALRCLLALTFIPEAQDSAVALDAMNPILEIFSEMNRIPEEILCCAVGVFSNLLQESSHCAKKQAKSANAHLSVCEILLNSDEEQLLRNALQAVSILASDSSMRNTLANKLDARISDLSQHKSKLLATVALTALDNVRWSP